MYVWQTYESRPHVRDSSFVMPHVRDSYVCASHMCLDSVTDASFVTMPHAHEAVIHMANI